MVIVNLKTNVLKLFERLVAAGYDLLTGVQSLLHLIILGVLPPQTDGAAVGLVTTLVEYEDPVSTGSLEEGASR